MPKMTENLPVVTDGSATLARCGHCDGVYFLSDDRYVRGTFSCPMWECPNCDGDEKYLSWDVVMLEWDERMVFVPGPGDLALFGYVTIETPEED